MKRERSPADQDDEGAWTCRCAKRQPASKGYCPKCRAKRPALD